MCERMGVPSALPRTVRQHSLTYGGGKIAYSIPEFCAACAVGRTFVYDKIKNGRLKALKAGRRTIVDADEAKRWLTSLRSAGHE